MNTSWYICNYTEEHKKACVVLHGLSFKLPHTGRELYSWAETLSNCLFSYAKRVASADTVIYGVFENHQLLFAVELSKEGIAQATRSHNRMLLAQEKSILSLWFEQFFEPKEKTNTLEFENK